MIAIGRRPDRAELKACDWAEFFPCVDPSGDAAIAYTELFHHGGQGVSFLAKAITGGGSLFDHGRILLSNLIDLIYCRVNFTQSNRLFFSRGGDFQRHAHDLSRQARRRFDVVRSERAMAEPNAAYMRAPAPNLAQDTSDAIGLFLGWEGLCFVLSIDKRFIKTGVSLINISITRYLFFIHIQFTIYRPL